MKLWELKDATVHMQLGLEHVERRAEPEARAGEEDGTLACVTDISVVGWLQMLRLDDCPEVIRPHVALRKEQLVAKASSRVADTDDAFFVLLLALSRAQS